MRAWALDHSRPGYDARRARRGNPHRALPRGPGPGSRLGDRQRGGRTEAPLLEGDAFLAGRYRLVFHVGEYFRSRGHADAGLFLEEVPVAFVVSDREGSVSRAPPGLALVLCDLSRELKRMEYDLLIRGASVVGASGVQELCVGIEGGRIAALAPELSGRAGETIDASGMHLFPGVIDAHVHFNEPGRTEWEGIATGSAALAAGGGSCFIDMPLNSSPPTLDASSFAAKLAACSRSARTDFALWGGLTPDNLDQLEALADCGVAGYKAFMSGSGIEDFRRCDDEDLYRGMRIAAARGLPVAVHAEDEAQVGSRAAAAREAGRTSARDYLDSRPVEAETEAISRAIAIAAQTGCRLHVVHTSSAQGARLIREAAAAARADVSCETCPHYLFFTDSDVVRLGARAKCSPPLRPAPERDRLLALVAEGQVDTIGSDHSPAPLSMKESASFFDAWGGISGVQSTLRVLVTLPLELPLVARLTSDNVARRFGLPGKGGLRVGADADCVLVDLSDRSIVSAEELFDRHRLSPYAGQALRGRVRRTLLRGRTIFQDGALAGEPQGRFLRPART